MYYIYKETFEDKYINKSKITGENTFNGDHFEIQGNHGSSKDEKTLFIYVFQALFRFCNFKATFFGFWKLGVSSLHSTLNFE